MKLMTLSRIWRLWSLALVGPAALCTGLAAGAEAVDAPAALKKPQVTLEQRVASLEAYVTNSDPSASLKTRDGKVPDGLATPTSAMPGPGHNGWQMTCAALVLFMTLPGLALFYGGLV
ncbi:MAG: hypothetical protein N2689_17895, partial [Verrucomicrobiae bacterium]|nr:hypothetical protein [Verrucomicrobiae bacterium]